MTRGDGPDPYDLESTVTRDDGWTQGPSTPQDRPPWRVFAYLAPVVVVLLVVAILVGYGYGKPAGEERVQRDLSQQSQNGARTPVPRPTGIAPEPFVSSMPRPRLTRLNGSAAPTTLVGPEFETDQRIRVLHPNLPFSFRAPAGNWKVTTPFPERDIAFADAYLRPTGTETAATSPLRAAFAWRACGKCGASDVAEFDARFRDEHDTPDFDLRRKDSRTAYTEITGDAMYYLVVRHLFDGSDGRTYLVDFMTQAPVGNKEQAQQLANEILTQVS